MTRPSTQYVGQLLPLSFLAPDIVSAVLTSTIPAELTAEKLNKRVVCPWIGPNRGALLGSRQHHNTVNWNRFLDPRDIWLIICQISLRRRSPVPERR